MAGALYLRSRVAGCAALLSVSLAVGLCTFALSAESECGDSYYDIYNGDCDFKNEDSHLWHNQPGWKLSQDKRVDSYVADARQALKTYLQSVKVTGDDAIRARLDDIKDTAEEAMTEAAIETALILQNDPYGLKTSYLDTTLCLAFWAAFDEVCPTTAELPVQLKKINDIRKIIERVNAIKDNPGLVLGEEWGDLKAELAATKSTFDRRMTLGRKLNSQQLVDAFKERFTGYTQRLAEPRMTRERWRAERAVISATLHDTVLDTLQAAKTLGSEQTRKDGVELGVLQEKTRRAVGRLQVLELNNMTRVQRQQVWLKITEQLINQGNALALDMADEITEASLTLSEDVRTLAIDPLNPTIIGNEPAPPLPR